MNPTEYSEKFVKLGEDWADKNAAACLLEDTKSSVLSKIMSKWSDESVASAKVKAERDKEYINHITEMVNMRAEANKAKVKFDAIKAWGEMWRTQEATRRAEMGMK